MNINMETVLSLISLSNILLNLFCIFTVVWKEPGLFNLVISVWVRLLPETTENVASVIISLKTENEKKWGEWGRRTMVDLKENS